MSAQTAPAPVRRRIWILAFVLLAGVLLAALATRRGELADFERRVADIKAAGQPTAPSDLPLAEPLAAEHVSELLAMNQAITQLDQQLGPSTPLTPGAPVFRETAELRQQILSLLRSDPVVRSLRIPTNGTGGYGAVVESVRRTAVLQRVEEFLLAASLDGILRRQANEALGSFTNAIRLRTGSATYPGAVVWGLDAGRYNRALTTMLGSGVLQSSHLAELQEAMEAFEAAPLMKDQLLADRVRYISDTRAYAACRLSSFSTTPGLRGMLAGAPGWISLRLRLQLGYLDRAGCLVLDEFAAQLAELDRIGDPTVIREADLRKAERMRSSPERILNQYFGPQPILKDAVLRPRTHLRLGLLALASARYRLDHAGRFPSQPSDLVPGYLNVIPTDPFSGGAPVFEPLNPGLAIGFDRSRLTGADSLPPNEPGGPGGRLILGR